jgi:hypothetical protein
VVAIAMIVMASAIPGIRRMSQLYAMHAAVTSVTGAIQAARYNAIFHGCRYQVVFTAATKSYTVANQVGAAGAQTCNATKITPAAGGAQSVVTTVLRNTWLNQTVNQ